MTSSTLALVPYVDRSRNPYCQTILRNIVTFEAAVLLARHPYDVNDIIAELHCIVAGMSHMRDWSLFPRLVLLMQRARDIAFRQCHALIQRCAELVDECDKADCSREDELAYESSYDEVALAVRACDDVLFYLVPYQNRFTARNFGRVWCRFCTIGKLAAQDALYSRGCCLLQTILS